MSKSATLPIEWFQTYESLVFLSPSSTFQGSSGMKDSAAPDVAHPADPADCGDVPLAPEATWASEEPGRGELFRWLEDRLKHERQSLAQQHVPRNAKTELSIPIGSMYGIYANIWGILMVNVTIYSIHGSYGIGCKGAFCLVQSKSLLNWNGEVLCRRLARVICCTMLYQWVLLGYKVPGDKLDWIPFSTWLWMMHAICLSKMLQLARFLWYTCARDHTVRRQL